MGPKASVAVWRRVPVARAGAAALLSATVLIGAGTAPAGAAEDPTPAPRPTAALSPPSQQQIDDAKEALNRLRKQGNASPAPEVEVAGPRAGSKAASSAGSTQASVGARISDEAWWTLGAGLLVLLVASETTRLGVKRAKHRKGA